MKTTSTTLALALVLATGLSTGCNKSRADAQSASAQQARVENVVVPDGTSVVGTLDATISTATSHDGDAFAITTSEPIMVGATIAVPAGSRITGELRDVQASGRTSGRAKMTLVYLSIIDTEGNTHDLSARPLPLEAESNTHTDVERIAAGGVIGAIVGGIAGGTKGAAIGAGAGAGAGTVVMLATQGDEVVLEIGQRLVVQTTAPTSFQISATN